MTKTLEEWEEILPLGDLDLVALNTRIPRKMSKDIKKATGILQTTNQDLTYTKQATVKILLERALRDFFEEWERIDQKPSEQSEKVASIARKRQSILEVAQQTQSKFF